MKDGSFFNAMMDNASPDLSGIFTDNINLPSVILYSDSIWWRSEKDLTEISRETP